MPKTCVTLANCSATDTWTRPACRPAHHTTSPSAPAPNAHLRSTPSAIKLILGGLSNAKDLRDISELLGDRHLDQASVSTGASHNVTVSTRTERALAVDAIRELGDGEALLLYRNMRAAKVHLPGTWEVPDIAKQVTISRREARQLLATARRADRTTQREQSMFTLEGVDGKRNPQ